MEKVVEQTSSGLIIWQIVTMLIILFLFYLLYQFSKKMNTYLNLKIKYLKQKLDSENRNNE
jgi:F0F1-type ATP synthase membrane subunit b/b'